jgi:hypothetical protein
LKFQVLVERKTMKIYSLVWGLCLATCLSADPSRKCDVNGVQLVPECPPVDTGKRGGIGDDGRPPSGAPEPMSLMLAGVGVVSAIWWRRAQ